MRTAALWDRLAFIRQSAEGMRGVGRGLQRVGKLPRGSPRTTWGGLEEPGRRRGPARRACDALQDGGLYSKGNRKQLEFVKQGSNRRRSAFISDYSG